MKLKRESITIDGIVFETQEFPAMDGLELMGRLVQVLGPTLGALASANPEQDLEALAPVLATALKDLKPAELSKLACEVLAGTTATVDTPTGPIRHDLGDRNKLNLVFSGRLKALFKVAVHAIKVNYGDFMGGSDASAPQTPAPSAE